MIQQMKVKVCRWKVVAMKPHFAGWKELGLCPEAQKLSSTGLGFRELEAVMQREAICQKGSPKDSELTEAGAAVL